jgi:hypothetical protein
MKHAGKATVTLLEPLFAELRRRHPQLREKANGSFYCKSTGYLHFHEDPAGIFADVKLDFVEFTRFRATTAKEQRALLARIERSLAKHAEAKRRAAVASN